MNYENKTKSQLIKDLKIFRQRIIELEHKLTKHKIEEVRLKDSESMLNGILSSMVDLVFAFNKEGKFIFCHSPRSEDLYLPPERFIGKKPSEIMPSHINKLFTEAFSKNKKGEIADYEYWLEIKGRIRWFVVKLSPLFLENKFTALSHLEPGFC